VKRLGVAGLCISLLLFPSLIVRAQGKDIEGRIAFAAFVQGNWDIYSLAADGADLRRHTFDPSDDLSPSWSSDGRCLAFQSHRDGNWEIYRLCADHNEPTRLTRDLAFDGRPAWSPDGAHIAFDSFRPGDLDIFLMDPDGRGVVNLTEDSPAGDFGPAWSPDGKQLAFTSWRHGDPDLLAIAIEGGALRRLTDSSAREADPTWAVSGDLAYGAHDPDEASEVYTLAVGRPPAEGGKSGQITWWGGVESPAWSPDGAALAALWQRYDGEVLMAFDTKGGLPKRLTAPAMLAGPLSWTVSQVAWGQPTDPSLLTDPRWEPSPGRPQELVTLADIDVSGPQLNSAVVSAFTGFRQAVLEQSGWDFLGSLSDMWRNPEFADESSDYLSWHKAGRAIDLLWDYHTQDGAPLLEVAPQVLGRQTHWRLYIRCRRQSGDQGEPLTAQTWDLSYQARAIESPETGGHLKGAVPYGYYVDVSALARQYGWEHISSYDRPDFHWHDNFMALEYWHLQRCGMQLWYPAMREIYSDDLLQWHFSAKTVAAQGEQPWRIVAKGIPYPPDGHPWWTLGH
jgi:Tol biopolymer transport system component